MLGKHNLSPKKLLPVVLCLCVEGYAMSRSSFQLQMDLLGGYGRRINYPSILGRLSARNLTNSSLPGSGPMPSAAGPCLQWETIPAPFGLQTKPGIMRDRWTEKIGLGNNGIWCPRGSWCLGKLQAWSLVL